MSESSSPPERAKTKLTHNSSRQFEFVLPQELTEYHGLEHQDRVGYTIHQDGQTVSLRGERAADVPESQSRSVVVQSGGQATIRLPSTIFYEQQFHKVIEKHQGRTSDDPAVEVVVDSRQPGVFDLSFAPPIEPVQVSYTADLDYLVKSLVPAEGGENMSSTSYRLFLSVDHNRRYNLQETEHAAFRLALVNGELGVWIDFDVDESEIDNPNVTRVLQNKSAGDNKWGQQYYLTFPIQFVYLLGWDSIPLRLYAEDAGIVVRPD